MKDLFWKYLLLYRNYQSYLFSWATACPAGLRSSVSVCTIPRASTNRLWKIRWCAAPSNLLVKTGMGCWASIPTISWNRCRSDAISDSDRWVCCYSASRCYSPCFLLSGPQQRPSQDLQNWSWSTGWNFHSFAWAWSSSSVDHHSPETS